MENKTINLDQTDISRQFFRTKSDGSLTRGYDFWEDMAKPKTWAFVEQLLPDYDHDEDVTLSNDLSCIIEKDDDWDMTKFTGYHPEYESYTIEQLKKELENVNTRLYKEAEEYLQEAIDDGEIIVREFPVTLVSAKYLVDANCEFISLVCADETNSLLGKKFYVLASRLQNVKCRTLVEEGSCERFQIYYINTEGSGDEYWCDATSNQFKLLKPKNMEKQMKQFEITPKQYKEMDEYGWIYHQESLSDTTIGDHITLICQNRKPITAVRYINENTTKYASYAKLGKLSKVVCSLCGSTDVRAEAWINPNNYDFDHYSDESFDYGHCHSCGNTPELIDVTQNILMIETYFAGYVNKNDGKEPRYANCTIIENDGTIENVIIKLSSDYNEDEDDDVFHFCNGYHDVKQMCEFTEGSFMIYSFDNFE